MPWTNPRARIVPHFPVDRASGFEREAWNEKNKKAFAAGRVAGPTARLDKRAL